MEHFTKDDLYNRGWKKENIERLLGDPDEGYLYHRKRVRKQEESREFILSKYNKEINNIIEKSNVKKISKDDIQKNKLDIKKGRKQIIKDYICIFIKNSRIANNNIDMDLLFSFSLEEMIEIFRKDAYKTMITDDIINNFNKAKKIEELSNEYDKSIKEIEEKLEIYSIDEYENILKIEKSKQDKKYRELARVEDIENFYKKARSIKRNFKAYLGPTNSGKTYNAIQALLKSNNAVYLAPLRLLAREVYELLKENGIKVSLITGEERIIDQDATHTCSTIEALNINKKYDLAVIDEAQFLNDRQRGSSWTRAVYGVYADNVICLGSDNVENVLKRILKTTNEEMEVIHLERKTTLSSSDIIYNVDNLQKGDAVIAFSRKKIYEYKKIIEEETDLKVGVIYGMMPPEIRIKTAKNFNSGELDIIIASDAIGIGLNLEIQRIVFTDLEKFDGLEFKEIKTDLFKQIAGRAGRYKKYDEGYVTICEDLAFKFREKQWNKFVDTLHDKEKEITKIYFFPELEHLMKIADELNEYFDIEKIIKKYEEHFTDENELFKKNFSFIEENLAIVNNRELPLENKYRLLFAPLSLANKNLFKHLLVILENNEFISFDDLSISYKKDIKDIEELIQEINMFRWMHFQYPENFEIGSLDEKYIELLEVLEDEMIDKVKR